jgi:hypothetical protein
VRIVKKKINLPHNPAIGSPRISGFQSVAAGVAAGF